MAATKKIDFCYRRVKNHFESDLYQVPVLNLIEAARPKILAKAKAYPDLVVLQQLLEMINKGAVARDTLNRFFYLTEGGRLSAYMEALYGHLNAAGIPLPPEIPMSEFGAWFSTEADETAVPIKSSTATLAPYGVDLDFGTRREYRPKMIYLEPSMIVGGGVHFCYAGHNGMNVRGTLDIQLEGKLTPEILKAVAPQVRQALDQRACPLVLGYQPTRFQKGMGWVGRTILWGAVAAVTMMGTLALLSGSALVFLSMAAVTAAVVYAERVTAISRWERFGAYLERAASGLYYDPWRVLKEKALTRAFWVGVLAPYLYFYSLQRSLFITAAAIRAFCAACGFALVGTLGNVVAFGLATLSILHMASLSVESIVKLWGVNKTVPAELPDVVADCCAAPAMLLSEDNSAPVHTRAAASDQLGYAVLAYRAPAASLRSVFQQEDSDTGLEDAHHPGAARMAAVYTVAEEQDRGDTLLGHQASGAAQRRGFHNDSDTGSDHAYRR